MVEEKRPEDWLDDIFPKAKQQREELFTQGVTFAQRYLVFSGPTSDPRARELFEHWTKWVRQKRLPVSASLQELAAHNALREFIEGIQSQIEMAQSAQSVTQPRK